MPHSKKPLVSVIIPVYNGERYLSESLASVMDQTYRPLEVIVVDDGSADRTAAIAQSYEEVIYLYQENQGHGAAKNAGIDASRGELLAFLDADDIWTRDKLTVQVDYLVQHPAIGYVISEMQNFLEPDTERPVWLKEDLLTKAIAGYCPSTMLVRREIFKKIGCFDPGYKHANDCDWFFRARDAGIPMEVVPQVLLHRRIHGSNMSYERQLIGASEVIRVVKSSIDRKRKVENLR